MAVPCPYSKGVCSKCSTDIARERSFIVGALHLSARRLRYKPPVCAKQQRLGPRASCPHTTSGANLRNEEDIANRSADERIDIVHVKGVAAKRQIRVGVDKVGENRVLSK
jgi:hypothetical protein